MNNNLSYEVSHVVITPRLIEFLKQKPKGRFTRLEAYFDLLSRAMVKKPFSVLPKAASAELLGEFDTTVTELAGDWAWQRATVRDFLSELSAIGQLARADSYKTMTITFEALKFRWLQEELVKEEATIELLKQSDKKKAKDNSSAKETGLFPTDAEGGDADGSVTGNENAPLNEEPISELEKSQRMVCRELYEEIFADMSDTIREWAYTPKVEHALFRAYYNLCGADRKRWQEYLSRMPKDNTLSLTIYGNEMMRTTAGNVESYFIRFGTEFLKEGKE